MATGVFESQPVRPRRIGRIRDLTMTLNFPKGCRSWDIHSALQRLRGNRKALKRLLRIFAGNHGDSARRIRQALESDDTEEARRLAHSLKGAAGNISATDLFRASSRLDETLRAKDHELSQRLLVDVEQSLKELVQAVNGLLLQDGKDGPQETGISDDSRMRAIELLGPAVKELAGLVRAFDAKAIDLFHAMKPQLDLCGIDEDVAELERLVDTYNLKAASGVLTRIAEQLGISWK